MKKITLWLAMLMVSFSFSQIGVGNGTSTTGNVPIYSCYGYTYSQQIYYQNEINSSGDITSISFHLQDEAFTNDQSTDWTIFLGHTSKTEFADNDDWEDFANLTQVYSGTITYPEEGAWLEIVFDTPFSYNNIDNLIVAVDENEAGYDCTNYWYAHDSGATRSMYYRNDTTNPDPATPPTAWGNQTLINNVIFGGIIPAFPPNCDNALVSPMNGDTGSPVDGLITWSAATGSPAGYRVTVGTTSGGNDIADNVDAGNETSYQLPMLSASTMYYVNITAYNDMGDATGCTEESFTTVELPTCATNLVATPNPDCGNFDASLVWDAATLQDGYTLTIGTTSGGNDVVDAMDLGDVTNYTFSPSPDTTYYWSVTAYNSVGDATACEEGMFSTVETGCYCDSVPVNNDGQGIGAFTIGTTDFVSFGDETYEDHTATVVDLGQGIFSNIQITFETGYTYGTNIWIDFNDNYNFEESELLYQGESLSPNPTTLNASFVMPADATLGNHRMRIGTADTGQATPNPCYEGYYGVTIDATVNIISVDCTPATLETTVVPDCDNDQYTIDVNIIDAGDATEITDGTNTWPVTGAGVITLGPLPSGTAIDLTVTHSDATCDLPLGNFSYYCPPPNDECNAATLVPVNEDLDCAETVTGWVTAASDSEIGDCWGTSDDDVWFYFIPEATTHVVDFTNVSGDDWTYMVIYPALPGGCEDLADNVYCGSGYGPQVIDELVVGEPYLIQIYSGSSSPQDTVFTLCVGTLPSAPDNDECANAEVLTVNADMECGVTTPGTVASATNSGVDTCGGTEDDDVWYSFTATNDRHVISLENVNGWVYKVLYDASAGCQIFTDNLLCSTADSDLVTGLVPGNEYFLQVYSGTSDPETFSFDVCVGTPPDAPANDDCSGAIEFVLNEGVCDPNVTLDFTWATSTDDELTSCDDWNNFGLWYTITAPASGIVLYEPSTDSPWLPSVVVYEGDDCGALTEVAGSCLSNPGSIEGLTPGETYYVMIFVESYETEDVIDLCLYYINCTPADATATVVDDCANSGGFYIDVEIADMGTAGSLTISNDFDATTFAVTEASTVQFGPFDNGTVVEITVGNDDNADCTEIFSNVTQSVCPPLNDNPSGAIMLTVDAGFCDGVNTNGDNTGATDSYVGDVSGSCFNGTDDNDVWFTFVAPDDIFSVDVSTDFAGATNTDTEIAVYSGTPGSFVEIGCDQDGGSTINYNSVITNLEVTAGETYYVQVSAWTPSTIGTFCLEVSTNTMLSIEDEQLNKFSYYPNPVTNTLNINALSVIENVSIFNLLGQEVITAQPNNLEAQLDMSGLQSGAYFVKVTVDNAVKTVKIIKE
ncbi:MAG: hypothetical protein BM564_07265 [Bacteroidetes bacterium MedPE-SWsnd-G2]|nr:MAG: hypothetical protein BM564_07265 [Bacteroidetes bacterium MedPE-SWsnd-G2]